MTVDDVMSRTGLSRPSFYEYFRDRHHLIIKLTERLGDWTFTVGEPWLGGGSDDRAEMRAGVEGLVKLYFARGHLLHALADAARQDKQVEGAYRRFIDRFIDATAARIRMGVESGAMKDLNAHEIATALILMNERYLIDKVTHDSQASQAVVVETLFNIWWRVLYRG